MSATLLQETIDTAAAADMEVYSRETQCRALAALLVFGSEEFVFNKTLNAAVLRGKATLENAYQNKDSDFIKTFRARVKELEGRRAAWLVPFCERFDVFITREIGEFIPDRRAM